MSRRYLLDLADILRAVGLDVVEVSGWQARARKDDLGGYLDGRPTHVMVHHTASRPASDGPNDVDYIVSVSPVAPVANLYISRRGAVYVCAAGPTNTNGAGSSKSWDGGVPDNAMNSWAIGIECANDGIGEPWPTLLTDALVTTVKALCEAYDVSPELVRAHFEWAPTRKIDPSGPSPWATSGKWDMNAFRASVAPQPEPDPLPEDDPMIAIYRPVFAGAKPTDAWIAASGGACRPATSYDLTWANDNGVPVVDVVDPLQYANLVKAAGL